jgi:hypothetical protein
MLSETQFRERAVRELRAIGKQVQSIATDRALFRRLESEVIPNNPALEASPGPYLPLFRAAYTDAMIMRLRRLYAPDASVSLRRLITQICEYPDMLHEKLTSKELATDLAEFETLSTLLKEKIDPHFGAHERTTAALESANREVDRALDHLADCIKRYYWIVADAYIDVEPAVESDSLAIFRAAWTEPK